MTISGQFSCPPTGSHVTVSGQDPVAAVKQYGAWQTVHRRHQQWSTDGTWDRVLAALQAQADATGDVDWRVSVDSTIARVHQHGATAARSTSGPSSYTGGSPE